MRAHKTDTTTTTDDNNNTTTETVAASARNDFLRARSLTENGYGTSPRVKSVVWPVSVLMTRCDTPFVLAPHHAARQRRSSPHGNRHPTRAEGEYGSQETPGLRRSRQSPLPDVNTRTATLESSTHSEPVCRRRSTGRTSRGAASSSGH